MSTSDTASDRAPRSDSRSLSEQAYDVVERMIVMLDLPPGHVFSEGELSEQVGIGRTPLREALRRLADERLVRAIPRRGMMITEINATEYLGLLDPRRVLDRLIAGRAARLASPDQRSLLSTCVGDMRAASENEDVGAFLRTDRKSDAIMEAACRNPYAIRAVSPLHAHCRRFWNLHRHTGDLGTSAALHSDMLEAVAEGDASDAEQASDALLDYLDAFTRQALQLV